MESGTGRCLYRHPRQRHYRPDHRRKPHGHRVQRYGCDGRQALHLPGDGCGRRRRSGAQRSVSVTAGRANQPPVAVGTLANRSLQVGSMTSVVVDVAGAFRDPDNDTLTYGASSSASSVASVSRSDSQVTVTPGSAGRATVTVTATDVGGSNTSATQRFTVKVGNDYDSDGDRLIEIRSLAQLGAIRYDLNGNGIPDNSDDAAAYTAAFPSPFDRMGCGFEGCSGYELEADLDFDTNGSGDADSGDTYWNHGEGWVPLGLPEFEFFTTLIGAFRTTLRATDIPYPTSSSTVATTRGCSPGSKGPAPSATSA